MKKYIISLLIALVLLAGLPLVSSKAQAAELSIRDLINLLILIDVIPQSKVSAVNAFLKSLDEKEVVTKPEQNTYIDVPVTIFTIPTLPTSNSSLEKKLRGPGTYSQAFNSCKADGMRLPNWTEAISTNINPSKFLTTYGTSYGQDPDSQRFWTSTSCGFGGAHASGWKGIPDVVKNGQDVRAANYWDNCSGDQEIHYYQCVDSGDPVIVDDEPVVEQNYSVNLTSVSKSDFKNSFDYNISSNTLFDKIVLRAACDSSEIEISAKAGMNCNVDNIILFNPTKSFSYPVIFKTKSFNKQSTVGMSVVAYYNGVKIGGDKDAVNVIHSKLELFWNKPVSSGDSYEDPRLIVDGDELVPKPDNASATKWCSYVEGKNYTSGQSIIEGENPNGTRVYWTGSEWSKVEDVGYARRYICSN